MLSVSVECAVEGKMCVWFWPRCSVRQLPRNSIRCLKHDDKGGPTSASVQKNLEICMDPAQGPRRNYNHVKMSEKVCRSPAKRSFLLFLIFYKNI